MSRLSPTTVEGLGLSPTEARVYVALLGMGTVGAQAVADRLGLTRGAVYPALRSLVEKGLLQGGAGYGSRFRAAPPESAVADLIERQREELLARERLAKELTDVFLDLVAPAGEQDEEVVEMIRDRRAVANRFHRLELEAEREIDLFVKAPILSGKGNQPEKTVLSRGVRVRSLYERAVLSSPEIEPNLRGWVGAGEEARVYPGELPTKLALFDRRVALLPLESAREQQGFVSLVIRHRSLGSTLSLAFERLWESSEPLSA